MFKQFHVQFESISNVYDCYNNELLVINYFERVCSCSHVHCIIVITVICNQSVNILRTPPPLCDYIINLHNEVTKLEPHVFL